VARDHGHSSETYNKAQDANSPSKRGKMEKVAQTAKVSLTQSLNELDG